MTPDLWYALLATVTVALLIYAFGWQSSTVWRDRQADRRQREADARTAADRGLLARCTQLAEQRAPMLTYAGWVEGTRWADWQGAQDRHYLAAEHATMPIQLAAGDVMDMVAAGYRLGQDRAAADQAHAEAEAIWADVEANPDLWRHR
jgi:hypothetical protein